MKKQLDHCMKLMGSHGSACKYGIANFLFLFVILGIELDMAGLGLSASTYWRYDVLVLKMFLIFFAVSYVVALAMAMLLDGEEDSQHSAAPARPTRQNQGSMGISRLAGYLKVQNPFNISMQIYHVIPGVRYYLLVKSIINAADVEAVMKINALSSFSLGMFQTMGICFTLYTGREINIFVKINIVTQCVNWLITFLYFGTPIAVWMGNGAQVKTLNQFYQGISNDWAMTLARDAEGCDDSKKREEAKKKKKTFKEGLANLMSDKFFANFDEAKRKSYVKYVATCNDGQVKDLINYCRLDAIASVG